jgi:hypothetical protein
VKTPLLTFDWPARHRIHLLLPFAVLIAALLHAAIFFLFSVKHPVSRSDGPNEARLYFLPNSSPEYARIESALHSSDPALFAPGRGLPDPGELPSATYNPQYGKTTLEWEELPTQIRKPQEERIFKGPVRIPAKKLTPAAVQPGPATRLRASDEISSRLPEIPEPPKFSIHSTRAVEPATFLIALSSDGEVLHSIPDKTSGDANLDRAALAFLRTLRFSPSDKAETEWGFLEFLWGADVQQPAAP